MSDTIVDLPKVCQMLDAGWEVLLYKSSVIGYSAEATHPEQKVLDRLRANLIKNAREDAEELQAIKELGMTVEQYIDSTEFEGTNVVIDDDDTPEQVLTRLAYKCATGESI